MINNKKYMFLKSNRSLKPRLRKRTWNGLSILSFMTAVLSMTACSMVNEDLKPCAEPPHHYVVVNFDYSYNMQEENWFDRHAGSVYLYVFDNDETFLLSKSKTKTSMDDINNPDFSIVLDESELPIGNKYKFVAVAIGNHAGYEASLTTPGFQLPEDQVMIPGVSKLEDYRLKLDRDGDGIYDFGVTTDDYGVFNFKEAYKDNRLKLDTLWSTKPNSVQVLDIPYIEYKPSIEQLPDTYQEVTVPMMRITNSVKINVLHDKFTKDYNPEDLNVVIVFPNGNGTIGFTGKTYPVQELMYLTLRKSMKQYKEKENHAEYDGTDDDPFGEWSDHLSPDASTSSSTRAEEDTKYCLEAEFGISRLQVSDGSYLEITDAYTGRLICRMDNFSDWLADYFEDIHNYDDQQFLDREYDWTIDIKINEIETGYEWYQMGCSVLGWRKREYNYTLH